MNQKRSCPRAPKRWTTSAELRGIRPKYLATVVVVFCPTPAKSSTPTRAQAEDRLFARPHRALPPARICLARAPSTPTEFGRRPRAVG
jgi:hypothetical protein